MNLYLYQPQHGFKINNVQSYWLPYSIGCLWAYASQFEDITQNWNLKELGFKREPIQKIISEMQDPDLVGLSIYIWNRNYCKELGAAIKRRWPKCMIVIGGPMVNGSWTKYDWVDSIVQGEGERCFVEILRTMIKKQSLDLFYKMERMETLSGVPSPYSTGVFNELIRKHPALHWMITLETNRGCPYQCTFCDWGGLTGSKLKKFDMHRIKEELDWIGQQKISSIFLADANLGIFYERDKEIARMIKQVADKIGCDYIASNFAKNSDERLLEIADILGETTKGLTFSVQSMNPETLKVIKRHNLKISDAKYLFELSSKRKIQFYTELMLGLPLESYETWINGICDLLEMGQHNRITVIPVMPLENTEMGDLQMDRYNIKTIEVNDGLRFVDPKEHTHEVQESYPWVCATNTMTTQEMIDSWMFGWMVSNFHTNSGYSMLLAKYCRNILQVSYRQFYERMLQKLNEDVDSILHEQYRIIKSVTSEIYTTGQSSHPDIGPNNHGDFSAGIFYKNYDQTHKFCVKVAESFGEIDPGVIEIQKRFMQNSFYEIPYKTTTTVDIDTWENQTCVYEIYNQYVNKDVSSNGYSTLEKQGKKLLNNVTKII